MTIALIMCQGQQRRLPELAHPKHLLEVDDEPILARTLRLLAEARAAREIRVVGPMALADLLYRTLNGPNIPAGGLLGPYKARVDLIPLADPGTCIVDGMLAARSLWSHEGRTLILLGDVVWSAAALAAFVADRRPLVFAGTPDVTASTGELFGVAFDDPQDVEKLCTGCPCRMDGARLRGFARQQGGHLRRLLWHVQMRPQYRVHPGSKRTWHEELYLPIEDWTDDIDTPADVARLPELSRLAELEWRAGYAAPAGDGGGPRST